MRTKPVKNVSQYGLIATAMLGCTMGSTTYAQSAPARQQAGGLEEVVVTARRREENLQNVPTAITGLSARQLKDLRIDNFGDVGQTVPNLNVQRQFGSASSPYFILRGVTTGSLKFETDAGIGLYIDGVYIGRPAASAFDLADIQRVEVLRGPQGTLFGRNSTGGAINFITAKPTGQFGVRFDGTVGNYSSRKGKLTINLPEFAGLAARLTILRSKHDGYVDNRTPGRTYLFAPPFGKIKSTHDFGNDDTTAFGLALHYGGIDRLSVDYKFDYTNKTSSQLAPQVLGTYGGTDGLLLGLGATDISNKRRDRLSLDFMSDTKLKVYGHSLTAAFDINDMLQFKSITSYRQFDEYPNGNDIDGNALNAGLFGLPGVPFTYISSIQKRGQHQWSQELQLLGTMQHVDWIVGTFWFKEWGHDNNDVFIGVPFFPNVVYQDGVTNGSLFGVPDYFAGSNVKVENESKAIYAHATWHITDRVELSGGTRYTRDDREEDIKRAAAIVNRSFKDSGNNTDYDVSLTYEVFPNVNVYGKYSTGYLSGGVLGGVVFHKETIASYEVGLKSDLLDNRLRVNVAVFTAKRKNLQTLSFSPSSGTFLADGGKSQQSGVEIEMEAVPVDGLTLTVNYGHLNDHFDNGFRSTAPENNFYGAIQYELPSLFNFGRINLQLNARWVDDHYGLTCPAGSTTTANQGCTNVAAADMSLDRAAINKANWQVGARLALMEIPLGNRITGSIALWGRNLLDTDELQFSRDLSNGTVLGTFQVPRTWGVDFSVTY